MFFFLANKQSAQNTTIEERVALLEIRVTDLDEDIDFLFDETVIQDERLLGLEQGINVIEYDLDVIDNDVESEYFRGKWINSRFCQDKQF